LTATYGGDDNFSASTSAGMTQTVNQGGSDTTVISPANPSVFGQGVTFTALVEASNPSAGPPTGKGTFSDGGTSLGTAALNAGVAVFASSTLSVGTHALTAAYSGDGSFTGSTSTGLAQTINRADSSTSITSSANPSVFGQGVTFMVTVVAN